MIPEARWYWLEAYGLAWVRQNLPAARVERHARVLFFFRSMQELRDAEAVVFPRGGLAQVRRAGFKPREARVETTCGVCARKYVPHYEDDPCIAGLPGVRFACCGHGADAGYVFFQNGIVIRFSGPDAIELQPDEAGIAAKPWDARFWRER